VPALPQEGEGGQAGATPTVGEGAGADGFLSGTIPRIVYKQARQAFPDNEELPAMFLAV